MNKSDFKNIKIKDGIIVLLILGVTFGSLVGKTIPEEIKKIDLFFIEIQSFGFEGITHLVYYCNMKILIISFSVIWYFTCKHWWKSAILIIFTIELSKLITSLTSSHSSIDEIDYITSLPITIPIVLLLVWISKKINSYNLARETRLEIDTKIDNLFFEIHSEKKTELFGIEQKFFEAKSNSFSKDKDLYLKDLISIRNEFYNIE